jgi:ketosteroid isomerase-like protein
MSKENVEIAVSVFERVNAREFEAVLDLTAEDVVLAIHGDLRGAGGEGAVGKEAVGRWFGNWFNQFDSDYRFEINESQDWGDRALVVATHHGRGRTSGVPVKFQTSYVITLKQRKVSRLDVWLDREEALGAAGMSE